MIRMSDGLLIAGDSILRELQPSPGDVVISDGNSWEIGEKIDWEPSFDVGVVEHVTGDTAIVKTAIGMKVRNIPANLEVSKGQIATYNSGPNLLEVHSLSSAPWSPLDEEFDVKSVRSTPNASLSWENFAGFPDLVQDAKKIVTIHANLENRRKLQELGTQSLRGIIFEGPPGTGKTFLAEIMAAQCEATFYHVTTASLGGRLVSESEQRLEQIYADAADQEMSIIFVDEIDSLTKDRGGSQEHGSRLVNVFLTNMDGLSAATNVITIGTTNRVSDIDKALRRPGRFDRELTFRHPEFNDRLQILKSGDHRTSGNLDFVKIATNTDGWSAADLKSIWQYAGELTVECGRDFIYNDHFLRGFDHARISLTNRRGGK